MSEVVAVCDACVFHSAPLRDLFLWLAQRGVFRARWTDRIHSEWMRSVRERFPDLDPRKLERTRLLMDAAVRDCLVTGYEERIADLELPDPDDRHVLAAAIHCRATVIVTLNLRDFPAESLLEHGISAIDPDEFICRLFESAPDGVLAAVQKHRTSLKRPPKSPDEYLESLRTQGLQKTAARLQEHRERS